MKKGKEVYLETTVEDNASGKKGDLQREEKKKTGGFFGDLGSIARFTSCTKDH